MKNLSVWCASICLIFCPLFYSACHEDAGKDKLPPITMEGYNTFGCLVGGDVWLSKGGLGQNGTYAELQTSGDTIAINIYADNVNRNDGFTIFFFDLPSLQVGKVYNLTDPDFQIQYSKRRGADNVLCTYENVLSGTVNLLRFDQNTQIISGTFEFEAHSLACDDTTTVTDGRFDLLYNR